MEDTRILELLWARVESALEALAEKFGERLYQTAMNILGCRQDAQECVNDTYFALWNAIPPERPEPLAGYVHRVGRNTALKRLRHDTAQKRDGTYDLSLEELSGCIPGGSLEEAWDAVYLGQCIDRFLDTLSRENRVLFLRRYWFGDAVKDISQALGLTENTTSVRLSRLRDKLRNYLMKEGYFNEA